MTFSKDRKPEQQDQRHPALSSDFERRLKEARTQREKVLAAKAAAAAPTPKPAQRIVMAAKVQRPDNREPGTLPPLRLGDSIKPAPDVTDRARQMDPTRVAAALDRIRESQRQAPLPDLPKVKIISTQPQAPAPVLRPDPRLTAQPPLGITPALPPAEERPVAARQPKPWKRMLGSVVLFGAGVGAGYLINLFWGINLF